MSIVGPYPLSSADGGRLDSGARFRFEMRPGITGYWRLGEGTSVDVGDLLAQDANYVRNWSLVQDAKILLSSFGKITRGSRRSLSVTPGSGVERTNHE